jgi:transposase-like protein
MITKEKLENYLKEQSTKSQIAQQENVTISTVSSWMKKYKLGYGRRSIQNCVV